VPAASSLTTSTPGEGGDEADREVDSPITMTKVAAVAMIARIAICWVPFSRLDAVAKASGGQGEGQRQHQQRRRRAEAFDQREGMAESAGTVGNHQSAAGHGQVTPRLSRVTSVPGA